MKCVQIRRAWLTDALAISNCMQLARGCAGRCVKRLFDCHLLLTYSEHNDAEMVGRPTRSLQLPIYFTLFDPKVARENCVKETGILRTISSFQVDLNEQRVGGKLICEITLRGVLLRRRQ